MTSSLKRRKQGTTLTLAMALVLVLEVVLVLLLELVLVLVQELVLVSTARGSATPAQAEQN